MKIVALISLCVSLSFHSYADAYKAARRSNGLLRFIAKSETIRDFALSTVMNNRCKRYVRQEVDACKESVMRQLKILDYDILVNNDNSPLLFTKEDPESFVFVAFKSNLISLLNDAKTQHFLELVNDKLTRFMTGTDSTPANIWETALTFYGSQNAAARAMAALFQDTSSNKLHLAWLHRSGTSTRASVLFQENQTLLARVIDTVNFIMDTSEDHYRKMFYPTAVQNFINRNIYHFYVPFYVSQKINEQGMKKEHALLGPLMMTLTYEFITSAPDLRYVLSDPDKMGPQSVMDIFGGYAGGRMGVGMSFQSFQNMSIAFDRTTLLGVTSLLPPR